MHEPPGSPAYSCAGSGFLLILVLSTVIADLSGLDTPSPRDLAMDNVAHSHQVKQAGLVALNQRRFEIRTPQQVLTLDASRELLAESWKNHLTSTAISLGRGAELEVDIGAADKDGLPVKLLVTAWPDPVEAVTGTAVFALAADDRSITAKVTYQWDAAQPVIRKSVHITNADATPLNRLLNVRLARYVSDAREIVAKGRGFPGYVNGEFFLGLAHPSGWVVGQGKEILLRQHPGIRLAPGATFVAMETVYGVAMAGAAPEAFRNHLSSRMRRTLRHNQAYAFFDAFGWENSFSSNPILETEAYLLDNIAKVAQGQQEAGCHFDAYSVDFWNDPAGDLIRFHPQGFPNGFAPIKQALKQLGTAPGLWIDSGGNPGWTIGANPAIKPAMTDPQGKGTICRATEPARSIYTTAFAHHIRENGVRLLKFDHNGNPDMVCNNPNHEHLPGVYSTEANHAAIIEFLIEMDRASPEVFLMLYWGYSSPWWLLHADTIFDCGLHIEARDPASQPTPHPRDTVTQHMDQGLRNAVSKRDIPALGKDSLGIWLSSSGWNSSIGKERWQEGMVMDICRGSMLVQPWTDRGWLTPPERQQMADFIALVKKQPDCFRNSRWILGDPWKNEAYGYSCTDGKRAFLAINNACWQDQTIALDLGPAWGLPSGGSWDIYRWHPEPARLTSRLTHEKPAFGATAAITLRPFEVVLLEVVPAGQAATLQRQWVQAPIPAGFTESTTDIPFTEVIAEPVAPASAKVATWTPVQVTAAASAAGTVLTVHKDGSILASGPNPERDTCTLQATTPLRRITAILLEMLPDPSLPNGGPGRAANGNFMLNELQVKAVPVSEPTAGKAVVLTRAQASFSQETHGDWPASAAIDGKPETAWAIDPQVGQPQAAVFALARPTDFPGGTALTITLTYGKGHGLGRFRLSLTGDAPVRLPFKAAVARQFAGRIPPASKGGTLVLIAPGPLTATVDGKAIAIESVWRPSHVKAPWEAWRIDLGPSTGPQTILVSGRKVEQAYLIPSAR
ncbi:hypothetical protein LBMAG53_40020 [Planctomycetota bacterium]|nr:hypothetical protein LBMAG53_40020 [Planctomycetota bacterium]